MPALRGESTDAKHKDEIQLESWSWGATQSAVAHAGGGAGAGKVSMQDFHFVMRVNKASPKLLQACADGTHLTRADLVCRKAGKDQQEFLKFTFTDIIVSSYQTGGSGASDIVPLDQVSLGFSKIEVEYKEQKADGTLGASSKAGWDLKTNKKT